MSLSQFIADEPEHAHAGRTQAGPSEYVPSWSEQARVEQARASLSKYVSSKPYLSEHGFG